MKLFALTILIFIVSLGRIDGRRCVQYTEDDFNSKFNETLAKWVTHWENMNKSYPEISNIKIEQRWAKLQLKRESINSHNNGNHSYCLGPNSMLSLTPAEILKVRHGLRRNRTALNEYHARNKSLYSKPRFKRQTLPASVDWSSNTGPVLDQGSCGACWAFASAWTLTGTENVQNSNMLNSYSEQELVNCVYYPENGCEGGDMTDAYDFWTPLIPRLSSQLAWTGKFRRCSGEQELDGATPYVQGYQTVSPSVQNFKSIVAQHPLAVTLNGDAQSFVSYSAGVYSDTSCQQNNNDHVVTLVGYGTDPQYGAYWKVKNSWGTDWGENGYARIKMGSNICGIEGDIAVYPVIPKSTSNQNSANQNSVNPPANNPPSPGSCVNTAQNCAYNSNSVCQTANAYTGNQATTSSNTGNQPCLPWSQMGYNYPSNYCRASPGYAPWCFYKNGWFTSWDYCFNSC